MDRKEGFWRAPPTSFYEDPQYRGLPWPEAHDEPMEDKEVFLEALNYAEAFAEVTSYRGWSTCRLCGKHNGSVQFDLRGWTWPEGYRHYIEVHNVRPSPEFKAFVLKFQNRGKTQKEYK